MAKIPVSVVVATKNESARIAECLRGLEEFQEVVVVDSQSPDGTAEKARGLGARVLDFNWNGAYPKKRQWILNHVPLLSDWVFFVDGDEIVTESLKQEINHLFAGEPSCAGYFIKGQYRIGGKILRFGLQNNKLALLNRRKIEFPVVDDLNILGMGEIEGHYQPVLKPEFTGEKIGFLRSSLVHLACEDLREWAFRHEKYARWEVGMNNRKSAWPQDPVLWREQVKVFLRGSRFRPEIMFLHSYVLKLGFLDGSAGRELALGRYRYYKRIADLMAA
jgi:glycosyltransferase involved in cell wall biosynthesis